MSIGRCKSLISRRQGTNEGISVWRIGVREGERQILPDGAIRPRQHLGDAHYANGRGSAIGQTQRDAPRLASRFVGGGRTSTRRNHSAP